jgi:DNA mismatch endonuclease, patch repair protein
MTRNKGMTRSELMGRVRQKGTSPELRVQGILREMGIRFRTNVRTLPGRPDIANRTKRFAIFVHGCFWHRHRGCGRTTTPKTNAVFWLTKFAANIERDKAKSRELRRSGFKVVTVWECETRHPDRLRRKLERVLWNN